MPTLDDLRVEVIQFPSRMLSIRAVLVALSLALGVASPSAAEHTTEPPFLTLAPGVFGSLQPIIDSGDVHDGVVFEGIPDGIGPAPGPGGTVRVFVNHEQSRVPFRGEADFIDASVTEWTLDPSSAEIVSASVAIPHTAGHIRFCSSSMAGPPHGLSRWTYFTNEESNDVLAVPPGAPYGPDPSLAPNRQAGYSVILDVESGQFTQVAGMGRHNHENTLLVPGGWNPFAILSTDDTFNAPASQLYMYLANHESHIWSDKGSLWAFRVTSTQAGPVDPSDPFNGANDYGDIATGDVLKGEFIRVPKEIARGVTAKRPQDALENWSNENNVFQFIRLEDLAYDKNNPRVVYLADTGERRAIPDPTTGRLRRGPSGTTGPFPNGRIFRMIFDENNPRKVVSFSILLDADAGGLGIPAVMHQPDNMDTSPNSLMVQEDSNQAPNSRIWRYDFSNGTWSVVASVNDPDWESSGIVDASQWFGEGAWLLDVQGHGDFVASEVRDGIVFKRESGQLLLMIVPGT